MVRKLLFSTVASAALLTGSAFAADLPARIAAPAPYVPPPPVFTWTGFYIGVNAGAAFNTNNNNNDYGYPYYSDYSSNYYGYGNGDNSSRVGFTGGGQAGYNWQIGALVLGLEADIQYIDRGRNNNSGYYSSSYYGYGDNSSRGGYYGTVRGRLGFAADRALFYVTGGFAYGNGQNNSNYDSYYSDSYYYGNNNGSNVHVGWTIGGGIEYAFTTNWTAKIEYDYVRLGNNNNNCYDCGYYGSNTVYAADESVGYGYGYGSSNNHDSFSVIKAGLNYKF